MRTPAEIFKLAISKRFYRTKGYMCNALAVMGEEGIISPEEHYSSMVAIKDYMNDLFGYWENDQQTLVNALEWADVTSHSPMDIYRDWDNRPIVKGFVRSSTKRIDMTGYRLHTIISSTQLFTGIIGLPGSYGWDDVTIGQLRDHLVGIVDEGDHLTVFVKELRHRGTKYFDYTIHHAETMNAISKAKSLRGKISIALRHCR